MYLYLGSGMMSYGRIWGSTYHIYHSFRIFSGTLTFLEEMKGMNHSLHFLQKCRVSLINCRVKPTAMSIFLLLDLVDHNILFTKLSKFNIPNFLLLWFASYLTNRQQRVRVNSSVSTFKNLKGAMPQGSWLGPLAFLVLIDHLSTGCPLHKYVDDTTLSE